MKAVEEAFDQIGVLQWADSSMVGTVFEGEFHAAGDEVIVRLMDSLNAIDISDAGLAGVEFVFAFQKLMPDQLRVIDQAYNFDVLVSEHSTIESLSEAMQ